jgi:hypothetical protein
MSYSVLELKGLKNRSKSPKVEVSLASFHMAYQYDTLNLVNLISLSSMPQGKSGWYLLQTNYDHWKNPLIIDDRRTPVSTHVYLDPIRSLCFLIFIINF